MYCCISMSTRVYSRQLHQTKSKPPYSLISSTYVLTSGSLAVNLYIISRQTVCRGTVLLLRDGAAAGLLLMLLSAAQQRQQHSNCSLRPPPHTTHQPPSSTHLTHHPPHPLLTSPMTTMARSLLNAPEKKIDSNLSKDFLSPHVCRPLPVRQQIVFPHFTIDLSCDIYVPSGTGGGCAFVEQAGACPCGAGGDCAPVVQVGLCPSGPNEDGTPGAGMGYAPLTQPEAVTQWHRRELCPSGIGGCCALVAQAGLCPCGAGWDCAPVVQAGAVTKWTKRERCP